MRIFGLGGPTAEQVLERGLATRATLVGIAVSYVSGEDSDRRVDDYALALPTSEVLGVRQRLVPDDLVRLGMSVVVCVSDGAAVIDWWATLSAQGDRSGQSATYGWKALRTPPSPGIVDSDKTLAATRKQGVPATVRVESVARRTTMFGMASSTDIAAVVAAEGEEPYRLDTIRGEVAFYASHLCTAGAVLPAWVRPPRLDRVAIDWAAAAQRDPGVGRPPGLPRPVEEPEPVLTAEQLDPRAAIDTASRVSVEGVDLTTLVTIQAGLVHDRVPPAKHDEYAQAHGIAPGRWAAVAAAWHQRCMSDWQVGAAYGEAIQAALRQR